MAPDRDEEAFLRSLAERADIIPEEARSLAQDFMRAFAEFVDRDVWDVVERLCPVEVDGTDVSARPQEERTMKQFLLEMSGEEEIETRRAAWHARAVAETIRESAGARDLDFLESSLEDEFLALFESRGRGELTEPDDATSEAQRRRRR